MSMMMSTNSVLCLFVFLIAVFLYSRYEEKRRKEDEGDVHDALRKYLLDDLTLGATKKPILWIHIPYEYNARSWSSFGSRSSVQLNQPYLFLTVQSIIAQCDHSFTICIIDDNAFPKLMPEWKHDLTKVSAPISTNLRTLAMMNLLHKYGGLICPVSFLCLKNLFPLYEKGVKHNRLFLGEMVNRNITSTDLNFSPSLAFCGAQKECPVVQELIDFIQRTMSTDFTAQSVFLGDFNRWCNTRARPATPTQPQRIAIVDGRDIGTKTMEEMPILVDDLLANQYLKLADSAAGIYIPADEILQRTHYAWFARLSTKQVAESNTSIGNYIVLTLAAQQEQPSRSFEEKPAWIGFWKTPSQTVYGMMPSLLGDRVLPA